MKTTTTTRRRGGSGNKSKNICVNLRTRRGSYSTEHRTQRGTRQAPGSQPVAGGLETHRRPQRHLGTENSQLPHWLIVSVEKDSHGDQGVIAVSVAESVEVCREVGPL